MLNCRIIAGRNTRSSSADNTNPPNETTDEVTRQLNAALPNMLTQLVQALGGNRTNQREATPSCNIKNIHGLMVLKEFFGIRREPVEFAAVAARTRLNLVNTLNFGTTRWLGQILMGIRLDLRVGMLVPHMVTPESQRVNHYIRGLAPEIKPRVTSSEPATIQGVVSMANRLTTDGIKDGLFKKKENTRNKRRSNDQNRNRGRDERNKRQRTRGNYALTVPEQGQGQR
ncbi:hypothetical protein Tco_0825232 [Tanacetum coccineum]